MALLKQLKVAAPLIISRALKEDSPQRKRVNAFLVRQMGENKGLWLKVGQMLSMHPESWEGLEHLPDSGTIPCLPEEEIETYLEKLLKVEGLKEDELITKVSYPGLAASLSQVHKVKLSDGSDWMIKLKLPGIKEVIEDQLSLFGLLNKAQKISPEKRKFSTTDYQATLQHSFEVELDYEQERKNIKLMHDFKERFKESAEVSELHPSFQGSDFIVMKELSGESWDDVLTKWTVEEKKELAYVMMKQVLYQYFVRGHCQGDFHPGNFFFKRSGEGDNLLVSIGWIDLGQCLKPSSKERLALFLAIDSLINKKNTDLGRLFAAWNFNGEKLAHIADRLPLLLDKIFTPFTYPSAFSLKNWHLKKDIDSILGDDRWWFRTAGSPDLFLSIRCWIGLFTMIESLQVNIFFRGIWLELEKEMEEAIPKVDLPLATLKNIEYDDLAKILKVQIFNEDVEKVCVQLPARSLEHIDELIAPETLEEMRRVGIKLDSIISEQLHKGLKPGNVVDFNEGKKRYLVTLL